MATIKASEMYTGHLSNSGGLQGHSLGDIYPCTVIVTGLWKYQGVDLIKGYKGELRDTYEEALADVKQYLDYIKAKEH